MYSTFYHVINTRMMHEFMDFVMKNNIVGVAIGMLIAAKVGDVVKSLVEDVFTPAVLAPTMKKLKVDKLENLSTKNGILYGKFLARAIDFLVVAIIVFIIIKNLGVATA